MKPLAAGAMVEADFWPECVRVVVLECKRAQGRGAEGVSAENLGYDIRSMAPDGAERSVEVQARAQGRHRADAQRVADGAAAGW